MQFVCEHCGKPYNKGEKYCKGCWKTLPEDNLAEAVIDNTDDYEVEAFIGKNADYYMEKFKKHRDKQLFMSLNWPALLFGAPWFFFRKMYLYGTIFLVVNLIVTYLISGSVMLIGHDVIYEQMKVEQEIAEFVDGGGELFYFDGDKHVSHPLAKQRNEINNKNLMMESFMAVSSLTVQVILRLFANCIYRRHIEKSIGKKTGGRSFLAFFISHPLCNVISLIPGVIFSMLLATLIVLMHV